MKKTISEMAKLSGVSVRTLHYYDEIGLLKPSEVVSETGYRYYDELAMEQLQQILFYRELDFPLKEIANMMHAPNYDKKDALKKQKELLQLKRKRLDKLIRLLDASLKGEKTMSFQEFDMSEIQAAKAQYANEVKKKYGDTEAFRENQTKMAGYQDNDWQRITENMNELLKKFSECIGMKPEEAKVQKLVSEWQEFITKNYYECTKDILAGLGSMYIADERFTENMDRFGTGTAKLMSEAITVYCG